MEYIFQNANIWLMICENCLYYWVIGVEKAISGQPSGLSLLDRADAGADRTPHAVNVPVANAVGRSDRHASSGACCYARDYVADSD